MATTDLPRSPEDELAEMLREALDRKYDGNQSALHRDCRQVSQPTISRLLKAPGNRDWLKVYDVANTLGLNVDEAERLWRAARYASGRKGRYLNSPLHRTIRPTRRNRQITPTSPFLTSPTNLHYSNVSQA